MRLYQAVTLGARSFAVDERGALVKGLPRHPISEDDVVIYAGATILGRITIGRGGRPIRAFRVRFFTPGTWHEPCG